MRTHFATIRSIVKGREIVNGIFEPGYYELEVYGDLDQSKGDAPGYVRALIAEHLAACVRATGLPLGEGQWMIEFTVFTQTMFNYPGGVQA